MKRLLCTIAVLCLTLGSAFAELYPSKRFVELGFDAGASVGQNALGIGDIFTKNVVIDFNELAKRDFKLNLGVTPGFHFNVNINGIGAGIETDLDFFGNLSIDKELFRLLAEGNELNEAETIGMSLNFESFLSTSIPVRFKIGDFRIKVVPTYFVPILYLPEPRAEVTYSTNDDGTLTAEARADFDLYSAVDISTVFAEPSQMPDISELSGQLKNGGFDLAGLVEYELFDFLDLGAYVSVPIYPGKLNYHSYGTASVAVEMDGVLDYYTTKEEDRSSEEPYTITPEEWSDVFTGLQFDENGYRVNRPFRLGVEAAWRPIGDWLVVHPKLGVAARNPFGKDFSIHNFTPEYSLTADLTFVYVFGLSLTTAYENQTFSHNLGMRLNARVLELDFNIGTSNSDFLRSFSLGGVQAQFGVKMGF